MEEIKNILTSDFAIITLIIINIILFILYLRNIRKFNKFKQKNDIFMKKLGNGEDILELLNENNKKIEEVQINNRNLRDNIEMLNNKSDSCLQKIGFVRYNAFKDTGSDLSFALVLLNKNNTGIVLNGIYSRETSNIYAKSIVNGKSEYRLSEEETRALNEAIKK